MTQRVFLVVILALVNIVSAVGVIEAKQRTRELFHQLQVERLQRDQLNTEWAQIQLEDSAWASPDRVSQVASGKLGMVQPQHYVVLGHGQ